MSSTIDVAYSDIPAIEFRLNDGNGSLADAVRDLLQEAILDGRLAPGSRVNVNALAARLGLSHIPIREALRALGADGWIEFRPHTGAFVCERNERELIDVFETRLVLEAETARLAAARRSPAQLDALEALLTHQRAATDVIEIARLNADFHVSVARCSQNEVHARFVRLLAMRARFYFTGVVVVRREASVRDHEALVDALRRRDEDGAAAIAREHVAATRQDVLQTLVVA